MATNASATCCSPSDASTTATCDRSASVARRDQSLPTFRPAVDVLDGDDAYRIVADLPGASADRMDIAFEDGVLTLEAEVAPRLPAGATPVRQEYGVGSFVRRFRVQGEVDPDAISASYADGVLRITLPKSTRSRQRRVPVSAI